MCSTPSYDVDSGDYLEHEDSAVLLAWRSIEHHA